MNHFKKFFSVFLALILMLSAFSACGKETVPAETQAAVSTEPEGPAGYYQVGDKMEDFTVTTYDGKEVSLYKVLEEKDMVLLNLWATWCGPCAREFPAMQEAYEQYQDKVEIIALSVEPTDSDEILTAYVQEKGMTFCVAADTIDLGSRIQSSAIPASVVVDRFGTICVIGDSTVTDPAVFTNLFGIYTAEDYTESLFLPSIHAKKPDVPSADPAALKEALNGEGGTLVFTDSANEYHWPMTVEQKDGRTVAVASNSQASDSRSLVETQVEVKAGDVLVMEYKLENNVYINAMHVEVDGKSIHKSAVEKDWATYAYRFAEAGNHRISVSLDVDWMDTNLYSNLWIDSIRVVSGDEAAKALENNPKYPIGEKTQIRLLNETVKKAVVYDESDPSVTEPVYICPDPTLRVLITMDESVQAETAFLSDDSSMLHVVVTYEATEDGFVVEIPNQYAEDMGTFATLYIDDITHDTISIYSSEEHVSRYCDILCEELGISCTWKYTDEATVPRIVSGDVTYTVTYVDQNGNPVPGVMCQVCDESMCQVFTSDESGVCQFTLPAKAYEIHTLMVPAGYAGDTTTVTKASAQGGELTVTLTKQ